RVVGARSGSPLVVGVGEKEFFLASDALALAGTTERIAYLEDGDVVSIDREGWRAVDRDGRAASREVRTVKTAGAAAELGPYRHFMQKEIFEQPRAVSDTLESVGAVTPALFGNQAQEQLAFLTHAGAEIGVASTKAFSTQLIALFLLSLTLAKVRGRLGAEEEAAHLKRLRHLPTALAAVLALEPQVMAWAERFAKKEHALFLGRGLHYPIALEGALKLKEISYIHAEAYAAGELKHGPLALVTGNMPVVTVAPNDALLEKLKSNMQEVRARGGELYVFADADTRIASSTGV